MPRHLTLAFAIVACALLTATGVASPAAARTQGPQDPGGPDGLIGRRPLAVTTGDGRLPQSWRVEAADRGHSAESLLHVLPPESLVEALIESTSLANVTSTIERLQAFRTRYVSTDSCSAAGLWIRDRLLEYGYTDVRLDTFRTQTWQDSVWAFNVLAYKPGCAVPSEHVVVGGHYDSVTTQNFEDPNAPAPGAEDNATGVAAVLEAARLLAELDTRRTLVFACWSGEEEGLWGSRAFVTDAVADSTDIVLYLNMDAIGYLAPPEPDGYMMADTAALAVAAWMCDVALQHTGYTFEPIVQPIGMSDHNSFWDAGYNVIDSQVEPTSHFMHTPDDVIENTSPEFATAIAAVNVVAAAAVAGVEYEDPNLPPETSLTECCSSSCGIVTCCPTFEWESVDFDGDVVAHQYSLVALGADDDWTEVPDGEHSVSFDHVAPGDYRFGVRAFDDQGLADPSPATHSFTASDTLTPTLTVKTNFLPAPLTFTGALRQAGGVASQVVYENERLVFRLSCDASTYCATADSVAVALGDSSVWSAWHRSPYEVAFRPTEEETAIYFRARDDAGGITTGALMLAPIEADMDLPLLHIDDWVGGGVPEETHDAFYAWLLAGREWDEWEPFEHMESGYPSLPSMEELGSYATVFWTVGPGLELLRHAQAESAYHYLEGFVRAGGDLILEGQSSLTALMGLEAAHYDASVPPPEFVVERVGVDSMWNTGGASNPSYPATYGWAFLGGKAVAGSPFSDVPVDTLGKWSAIYPYLGGVPWCEVVRPTDAARRIYLFDSFLNPTLQDLPCATIRYAVEGTGSVAHLGFPFYYLKDAPARGMLDTLFAELESWQEPAELVFFDTDPSPTRVTLTWYLDPVDGPAGCHIERAPSQSAHDEDFQRLNDSLIESGEGGRFTFIDDDVLPATSYAYRLLVVERWGGVSVHGPWAVFVPEKLPEAALLPPVPNPAERAVSVGYEVGQDHTWVQVAVYDCAGRVVDVLYEGSSESGEHSAVWNGTDSDGRCVAAGVYFIRARIGENSFHRKVALIR